MICEYWQNVVRVRLVVVVRTTTVVPRVRSIVLRSRRCLLAVRTLLLSELRVSAPCHMCDGSPVLLLRSTALASAIPLCLLPAVRLFQHLVHLMVKVRRSLDRQEIRVGEEVDSRLDFRHKQDVFMQVLLSAFKTLVDSANQVERRASLACHRLVRSVSDDTAYVLAVLKQQLAEQISVLIYEQSLRVCHFVLNCYLPLSACVPLDARFARGEIKIKRDKEINKRILAERRTSTTC